VTGGAEGPLDLQIRLSGRTDITGQIYRELRDAILDGRLRAREAVPSSRELARTLEVSRSTILLVYERLRAEGFVTPAVGSGTFVSDGIRLRRPTAPRASPLRARAVWDGIPEGPDMAAVRPAFDFRPGIPDVTSFPFAAWRARLARQFYPRAVGSAAHIGAAGHPALRAAIARHVSVSRAV
jgi:GntR family transcriptional regulator / MocR family aminotransferase